MSGGTGRKEMRLAASSGAPGESGWTLDVFAAGQCKVTVRQRQLACAGGPASGIQSAVIGAAHPVNGRRGLWVRGYLAWQYAKDGWALLSFPNLHGNRADVFKVAAHARYGVATVPALAFPVQLQNVPREWQVSSVAFMATGKLLCASDYVLTAGTAVLSQGASEFARNLPMVTAHPDDPTNQCFSYPRGRSKQEMVRGYFTVVSHLPSSRGSPPQQEACAAEAEGLTVDIRVIGYHPVLSALALFKDHVRLLGPNPTNWTTRPFG